MELFELMCIYETACESQKAAIRRLIHLGQFSSLDPVFELAEEQAVAFPSVVSQMHQEG